ncbi:peptidase C14, caspase domain-containing protein [Mycena leptocephala]|nr:peptidase C14, caspase domain-containing protein [Mycena leptocephala]
MPSCDIYSSLVNLGLAVVTPHLARKRAFLIGVASDLEGPHQDVQRFHTLLVEKFGFQNEDIIMMLDDGVSTQPTKANIMASLKTFLLGQRPGDLFVFVYAGHATQAKCLDGTERDGLDEFIMTCDGTTILDDVLHDYLVKPLAPSCRLVAFLDACHSETLLDLKHHLCNRPGRSRRTLRRLWELTGLPMPASTQFCSGICPRVSNMSSNPNVICFSACKDSEEVFETDGRSMLDTVIKELGTFMHS